MASERDGQMRGLVVGRESEYRGYQPQRPVDVEDVPPEQLVPPTGVTSIAPAHSVSTAVPLASQASASVTPDGGA